MGANKYKPTPEERQAAIKLKAKERMRVELRKLLARTKGRPLYVTGQDAAQLSLVLRELNADMAPADGRKYQPVHFLDALLKPDFRSGVLIVAQSQSELSSLYRSSLKESYTNLLYYW